MQFPVLLDSAASGSLARYTLLAACPTGILIQDATGRLSASGACAAPAPTSGGFLDALDACWRSAREEQAAGLGPLPARDTDLPFRGGWFVHLAYEVAQEIEPSLKLPLGSAGPRAIAWRVPAALVYEHAQQRCLLICESHHAELVPRILAALAEQRAQEQGMEEGAESTPGEALSWVHTAEDDPERFLAAVRTAREHIAAGDTYQTNLSRAWRLTRSMRAGDIATLYRRLAAHNPAPFAALLQLGDYALLSSSPERLICVRGGAVATRPIAGTRPRIPGTQHDALALAELIAHPKERAEHVMLIDLERNDLGRLCVAGSVHVDEFMVLETYAHVHHIVSNVTGLLRAGTAPADVLRAVFPGGTITGCPKVRSMQIIAELEGEARGAYTGALGYVNHDGSMDFNILIRTLTVEGPNVTLRAGAGIVADSVPELELAETRAKARGLLLALGIPA